MSHDLEGRCLRRAKIYLKAAKSAGWWLTPDAMVGLADAAVLVGKKPKTLRNLIALGEGPPTYRAGGTGPDGRRHRVAIGLLDLATWVEMGRQETIRQRPESAFKRSAKAR